VKRGTTIDHPKTPGWPSCSESNDGAPWEYWNLFGTSPHATPCAATSAAGRMTKLPKASVGRARRKLIQALVQSKWLDRDDTIIDLIVHDWHDHCDDSVKKTLRNRKEDFATCPESSGNVPEQFRKRSRRQPGGKFRKRSPQPEP
jgi:hypothetical protein